MHGVGQGGASPKSGRGSLFSNSNSVIWVFRKWGAAKMPLKEFVRLQAPTYTANFSNPIEIHTLTHSRGHTGLLHTFTDLSITSINKHCYLCPQSENKLTLYTALQTWLQRLEKAGGRCFFTCTERFSFPSTLWSLYFDCKWCKTKLLSSVN